MIPAMSVLAIIPEFRLDIIPFDGRQEQDLME